MGLLRLLLALSVLTAHMHGQSILGFRLIYGNLAVQCFFMISGFYMALVINEKYNRVSDYIPFLWQRILRLFPAYFVVLFLTLAVTGLLSFAAGKSHEILQPWVNHASIFTPRTWIALIFTNLFLFGDQVGSFQAIDPATGALYFTANPFMQPIPVGQFLLVGQAWTLALELTFYIMAPALVRLAAYWQILIIAASVVLRLTTSWMINPAENPWHMDRYFPYEIAFFMAGSIGYQLYRSRMEALARLAGQMVWFRWVFVAIVLFYSRLPGNVYAREAIFIPLLFFVIPALFEYTKNNSTDRLVGELSYPLYLIHGMVLFVMRPWVPLYFPKVLQGPLYAAMAIGMAYVLYRAVDEKVDAYRHRLFTRQRAEGVLMPSAEAREATASSR